MKSDIRILLVDDNLAFLEAATRFLTKESLIVVGRALSGIEALEQTVRLRPDVVVMDLAMPEMNGLEAVRRIKAQPDPPRVIVLTLHDNGEYRSRARLAGADGFVAKSELGIEFIPLLHTLLMSEDNAEK